MNHSTVFESRNISRRSIAIMFAVLAIPHICGCGEYECARFSSQDHDIDIIILCPGSCDEYVHYIGEVQGVQGLNGDNARFGLSYGICGESFDITEFDSVEGKDWFALISTSLLADSEYQLEDVVFGVVDRRTGQVCDGVVDCRAELQQELLAVLSARRTQKGTTSK